MLIYIKKNPSSVSLLKQIRIISKGELFIYFSNILLKRTLNPKRLASSIWGTCVNISTWKFLAILLLRVFKFQFLCDLHSFNKSALIIGTLNLDEIVLIKKIRSKIIVKTFIFKTFRSDLYFFFFRGAISDFWPRRQSNLLDTWSYTRENFTAVGAPAPFRRIYVYLCLLFLVM